MKRPYSSEVCSRRLVRRQDAISLAPSCTPTLVLVLPTSSSRSTGDLPRDDAQQRAILRADEQGSGLVEVHGHTLAAVGGADARAESHAVAAPGRPQVLALGEEFAIARVEGVEQRREQAIPVVDASGEQAQRRGACRHLRRKL